MITFLPEPVKLLSHPLPIFKRKLLVLVFMHKNTPLLKYMFVKGAFKSEETRIFTSSK